MKIFCKLILCKENFKIQRDICSATRSLNVHTVDLMKKTKIFLSTFMIPYVSCTLYLVYIHKQKTLVITASQLLLQRNKNSLLDAKYYAVHNA